ncbi:MAG: hypothetical protein ACC661_04600, partial [Verrucomicrobiales bacterium]
FNTLDDKGNDGNAGINAGPSIEAVTVLRSDAELEELRGQLDDLQNQLRNSTAGLMAWEKKVRRDLEERGKDLVLHPLKLLKISVPNRGNKYEIRDGRIAHFEEANGSAHSISAALPTGL